MYPPKGEQRQELSSRTHYRSSEKMEKADQEFLYRDADLMERHGYVPYWLKIVTTVLIAWELFYLLTYWSPPAG
jgi:hypothetical protein